MFNDNGDNTSAIPYNRPTIPTANRSTSATMRADSIVRALPSYIHAHTSLPGDIMANTKETTVIPTYQLAQDTAAKQLYNASLPVSRIPPELLAQIMAGSLIFMDLDFDNANANTTHTHPSIAPSHVSSSWREVTFQSHELWSRIQIQMFTNPSLVEHIWQNTGSMPVDLEFCGSSMVTDEYRPRAFAVITRIFHHELGRIKSIRTFCQTAVLKVILSEITGRADSLESLALFGTRFGVDDPLPIEIGQQFLSGGAPKLRCIEPMALSLPWTSQALTSPSLTHAKFWYTEKDLSGLFTFLKQVPQLEVLEVHNLPYTNEPFKPDRFPVVSMPNLKQLYLSNGGEWATICTALSTIRMPLDHSQEGNVTVFCGSPLNREGDLSDSYLRTLVGFFGGRIAPEEVELYQEGDHGWEAVKVWNTCRLEVPDHASTSLDAKPSVTFHDRPEWVQLGFGRTSPFSPALDHQALWSLGGLRAITLRTCYWASDLSPQFWSMLGNLGSLEVIRTDAERVLTEPFFKELGQNGDKPPNGSALSFPSLRAIVLCYLSVPSGPASSSDTDGSERDGEEDDGKTELDVMVNGVLQAFKNRGGRQLDEFKLFFDTCVGTEDRDVVRSALMDLENGSVARRVGVWDLDGEITWNSEVHDPIDHTKYP